MTLTLLLCIMLYFTQLTWQATQYDFLIHNFKKVDISHTTASNECISELKMQFYIVLWNESYHADACLSDFLKYFIQAARSEWPH